MVDEYPLKLTPRAIYSLAYEDHEKIRDNIFIVQIVNYKDQKPTAPSLDMKLTEETNILMHVAALKAEQKNNTSLNNRVTQCELSDGISTVTTII
jgi:hypothetical protein